MKPEAEKFVELMGRHFEEEGAPRIAGRLIGVLLMNREPASLDDLAHQLRVSKASVSMNARMLEAKGVAEKVTSAGDRRDFYRIAPDAREQIALRMVERTRLMTERLDAGLSAAENNGDTVVCERFRNLISFFDRECRFWEKRIGKVRSAGTAAVNSRRSIQ